MNDPLGDLRDIVVPAAPAAAPDWLLFLAVMIVVASAIAALSLAFRRRPGWQRQAVAELDRIVAGPADTMLEEAARLLRRIALRWSPDAARLTGEAWLAHLDTLFSTTWFTRGEGRVLADGLYRSETSVPDGFAPKLRRLLARRRIGRGAAR